MLGMMNCSSDQIEFYATRATDRKYTSQYSEEQTKAFTEVKHKPAVSYTQDGRRLIDGNLEKEVNGVQLWHEVIKKKTLCPTALAIPGVDGEASSEDEDTKAVTVAAGEPVLAKASKKIKKRIEQKVKGKQ